MKFTDKEKYENLLKALVDYCKINKDTRLDCFLTGYLRSDWLFAYNPNRQLLPDPCPECGGRMFYDNNGTHAGEFCENGDYADIDVVDTASRSLRESYQYDVSAEYLI